MSSAPHLQRVEAVANPPRWPVPWVFSILVLPQAIYLGFVSTALPFLLSKASVPVDRIAGITSLLSLPWVICFLWAPLIDVKLQRKIWLIIAASATAVTLAVALPLASAGKGLLVSALGLGGAVAASLVIATCGGLMVTTLSAPGQAKASAWYEAGKLGGSALGAALMLWLAERFPPAIAGLFISVIVVTPAFLALTIPEPLPERGPWFKGRLSEIAKAIRSVVASSTHRWSVLLLASPIGSGAAMALLPAVARNYGVGANGVIWVNGVGGGIVLALGSLSGALLPGKWDRRLTYASAGLLNAFAAMILLWANHPSAYFTGTIFYLGTTGLCWARYAALLVEAVGGGIGRDVGTLYSVLTAAGTIPLVYMVWLDGIGFRHFGTRGLFWTDASGNLLLFLIVTLTLFFRRRPEHAS